MTEQQLEYTFDLFGYSDLYQKLRYPIKVSGEFDNVDIEVLESFLDWYVFDNTDKVLFDDFIYHFRVFRKIYKNNNLPYRPW
ncbi:hypothetical protein [Alteribacillus bidgolensis]|uniref:Uncharacterized protein n=1 Tax=Alteribacillus bidgolensis TaxID=930129 RepID=A0A1G8EF06_9BACI|nr:hypothetical protein [Alteribacillus bidgolensis]SDH68468.1 hypothetical protein SAMN05216352_102198 [Alteribacillus bidgolensis]